MYVGYVDDFETPEMIQKKFEQLEKLEREGKQGAELNKEMFKQTSNIGIQQMVALGHGAQEVEADYFDEDDDAEEGEGEEFLIDPDVLMDDEEYENLRKKSTAKKEGATRKSVRPHFKGMLYDTQQVTVIRKKRIINPREVMVTHVVDDPMPRSWGFTIKPLSQFRTFVYENDLQMEVYADFKPSAVCSIENGKMKSMLMEGMDVAKTDGTYVECKDMLDFDFAAVGKFEAIYMNPPYHKGATVASFVSIHQGSNIVETHSIW